MPGYNERGNIRMNVTSRELVETLEALADVFRVGNEEVARYVMQQYAEKTVEVAQAIIRGDKPNDWDALWNEGRELFKWTPEFAEPDSGLRVRQVRRGSDHPLYDTGELHDSIRVTKLTRRQFWVGSDHPGARTHEEGGINPLPGHEDIPARPFLLPAYLDVEGDKAFNRRIQKEADAMLMSIIVSKGKKKKPTKKTTKRKK